MAGITGPLTVLSAADSTLWTTVARVRDELELGPSTGSPQDQALDVQLRRRIERASRRLLNFTNLREVAFQKYQESIPGMADTVLLTSRTPIVNVIKIEIVNPTVEIAGSAGQDITSDTKIEDPVAGMLFRQFGWTWSTLRGSFLDIRLTETGDQFPGMEEANFRVTYEAGWLMPAQTIPVPTAGLPVNQVGVALEPFPADLEEAAVKQVVYDHARRSGIAASGVKVKDVGDTRIEFFDAKEQELATRFGLAPDAFYLADRYRRAA